MRALLLVGLAACSVAPGRGELEAEVYAVPTAGTSWVDEAGRQVELTEARITWQDLHLVEPRSVARTVPVWPLWTSVAMAHPGHDDAGPVGGELLGTFEVDLLQPETLLGTALLFEGDYGEAELAFDGPVVLVGTVDGMPFRLQTTPDQAITAIPFVASFTAADAPELELRFDASWPLSYVDWEAGDVDGDGEITGADRDQAELIRFGVHSNAGYEVVVR